MILQNICQFLQERDTSERVKDVANWLETTWKVKVNHEDIENVSCKIYLLLLGGKRECVLLQCLLQLLRKVVFL